MFKKFKDKLAEEVKSSPQRIHQFAQAAQAAVTSASSSVSDITNSDLFSIGENDSSSKPLSGAIQRNATTTTPNNLPMFPQNTSDLIDTAMDYEEKQGQRRLSNSSFASDISFRFPNYESPSMYHLQSDMDVSASEAEEVNLSGNTANLDRVTKKQLYAAYCKTREKFIRYKSQYSDLARHYKLLERENAKARNVLVETQDKALRRISELKEQCSLEQSAKAHLEKALRVELEEKSMKIDALSTQLNILQNNVVQENKAEVLNDNHNNQTHLINLNDDYESVEKQPSLSLSDTTLLNNKIEKLEVLLNKYKESLRASKEKNSQLSSDIQKLNFEQEDMCKENNKLKSECEMLTVNTRQIKELQRKMEDLENMNNTLKFTKTKETAILEDTLKNSKEEISNLLEKIDTLRKREEDYAISLAENKLRIHKELENKESEIKSLKESLSNSQIEIDTLNKAVNVCENKITELDSERSILFNDLTELNLIKTKFDEISSENSILIEKIKTSENVKARIEEEYKCLELQIKQETAEKLAMIDRNVYLESRNSQLTEENVKKSSAVNKLETELLKLKESNQTNKSDDTTELKIKCKNLESEIHEERVELVKLQAEIEKMLFHHEKLQNQNLELNATLDSLKSEHKNLRNKMDNTDIGLKDLKTKLSDIRNIINIASKDSISFKNHLLTELLPKLQETLIKQNTLDQRDSEKYKAQYNELCDTNEKLKQKNHELTHEMKLLKNEIEKLNVTLQQKDDEQQKISENIRLSNADQEQIIYNLKNKCEGLVEDNKKLIDNKVLSESNINKLKEELNMIQSENKSTLEELNIVAEEKRQLLDTTNLTNKKIKDLENSLESTKTDNFQLQESLLQIKESQLRLEKEKIDLQNKYSALDMDRNSLKDEIGELEQHLEEQRKIVQQIIDKSTQSQTTQTDINDNILAEKPCSCDTLKEDNKRLCSDIEGLQIYLSKISKENSDLNDKLRELIATSDNIPNKSENDLEQLRTEIQVGKDKIEDLLRENTMLIEENFELKDQIQSHINSETNDVIKIKYDENVMSNDKKYDKLLSNKNDLEIRITELEQMNNSLNKNVDHNQEKYDKLKISNEKLQRKLDEALVSLRHLHSLEENTEIEYLRNILYEYLTGSGTHSLTLAKVLSAVVKFDTNQTEQVLQKEKERQGLLHQLGLI